jgi:hypothetical protein
MALAVLPITEPGGYVIQFNADYSKTPFDGEKSSRKEPVQIHAVEQTIYFATGNPNKSVNR